MNPVIYRHYAQLLAAYPPPGPDVLEIGATNDPSATLLTLVKSLRPDARCVGINLQAYPSVPRSYALVQGNANDMAMFGDRSFDAVLCNAVLEHDPFFWKTLAETRRVLRIGGLFYVGVPGYSARRTWLQRLLGLPRSRLAKVPLVGPALRRLSTTRLVSTPTYMVHEAPGDYYRFSGQAVREVLLQGFDVYYLESVLTPVRVVAVGRLGTPEFRQRVGES